MNIDKAVPQVEGKVALIVGGSRGIGAATARAFLSLGAKIVVAGRDRGRLETFAASLPAGSAAKIFAGDIVDAQAMADAVDLAVSSFGRLDCAFNNAGGSHRMAMLEDLSREDFEDCLRLNVTGVFSAMQFQIRAMRQTGGGGIVNTASSTGIVGSAGLTGYTAAKHGLVGLSKAAAIEYAPHNIRVNVIAPGAVLTDQVLEAGMSERDFEKWRTASPMKRAASPEEIAGSVVWLCSDSASYVTGTVLPVDGGYVAR